MINNLNILLPEIFLTLSIFSILMIGVFVKNSFNLIFNLSSFIILSIIVLILNSSSNAYSYDILKAKYFLFSICLVFLSI